MIDHCRSCNDPIIWALTRPVEGKMQSRMPVNSEPAAGGNIELHEDNGVTYLTVIPKVDAAGRADLRTSHFATCKQAKEWRKR